MYGPSHIVPHNIGDKPIVCPALVDLDFLLTFTILISLYTPSYQKYGEVFGRVFIVGKRWKAVIVTNGNAWLCSCILDSALHSCREYHRIFFLHDDSIVFVRFSRRQSMLR